MFILISNKYANSNVKQFTNLNSQYRQEDTVRLLVDLLENDFKSKGDYNIAEQL